MLSQRRAPKLSQQVILGHMSTGEPYYLPIHHTGILGMSNLSGKSTTGEAILRRLPGRDVRCLVFLTKRGEKTFVGATQIMPYYRERADWKYVRTLLEAAWREKLKFETPWIYRICKGPPPTKDLKEVRQRLGRAVAVEKMKDFDRNIYTLLIAYIDEVLPVLEDARESLTDTLTLKPGINVMDLTHWYQHEAFQMLIIRACMEEILAHYNDIIIVLPEAWKMLPQGRNTPVKIFFEKFIREGATNNNFLLIDAQDLGGVDKEPLRQVSLWLIGKMMQMDEVKRLLEQIPGARALKITAEDIQTLKLGHFIVVNGIANTVTKVYVWPHDVPENVSIEVARGIRTPESVRDEFLKRKIVEDEDIVYKELYEKVKKERDDMVQELEELKKNVEKRVEGVRQAAFAEALKKVDEIKKEWKVDEYQKTIAELKDAKETLENNLKSIEEQLKPLQAFKEAFIKVFGPVSTPTTTMPTTPSISVAEIDERINQRLGSGPSPIPVVSVDVDQRIKDLVKNEAVNRIVTKIQALPEPAKKAAWWLHEKRQANIRALYNYMFDKPPEETGRIPGTFYMNVVNPLQDAWLIVNEGGNIRWSLQEKLQAELKEVLTDSDLEKVPKYLASLLL